jgi:hypothetical protein
VPVQLCETQHCLICEHLPGSTTFGWRGPWSCKHTKEGALEEAPRRPGDCAHRTPCTPCKLLRQIGRRASQCRHDAECCAQHRASQERQSSGWFIRRPGPAPPPKVLQLITDLTTSTDDEGEDGWSSRLDHGSLDTGEHQSKPEPEPEDPPSPWRPGNPGPSGTQQAQAGSVDKTGRLSNTRKREGLGEDWQESDGKPTGVVSGEICLENNRHLRKRQKEALVDVRPPLLHPRTSAEDDWVWDEEAFAAAYQPPIILPARGSIRIPITPLTREDERLHSAQAQEMRRLRGLLQSNNEGTE